MCGAVADAQPIGTGTAEVVASAMELALSLLEALHTLSDPPGKRRA